MAGVWYTAIKGVSALKAGFDSADRSLVNRRAPTRQPMQSSPRRSAKV